MASEHPSTAPGARFPSETAIILLIAAVQFVNILDFVMVMPLGPDFAKALHFPESENGYVAGAYTGAAFVSGLIGSFFLDRFDRRNALVVSLVGLSLGTMVGGFATGLDSLMAARCLAGVFGGPATSLSLSIIADVVPAERRGKAMGMVMGAFGAAAVLGVPLGLELAEHLSWRAPFFAVAGLGAVIALRTALLLPSMRGHIATAASRPPATFAGLFGNPLVIASYLMTAVVMTSGFIIIPNISAYLQENLGFPRGRIPLMYLLGGAVSVVLTPLVGRLVDRIGSLRTGSIGSGLLLVIVYFTFYREPHSGPILPWFVGFFIAMAFRNVAYNTLTSKVPAPQYRARFMSIQSAVQHWASTAGGFVSAAMLSSPKGGGRLEGMPNVALVTIVLSIFVPVLLAVVEYGVKRRASAAAPATSVPRMAA